MGDDAAVYACTQGGADRAGLFQRHDGVVGEVAAATAVLLGNAQQQHAGLTGLVPGVAVDALLLGPALIVGHQLFGDEAAHGVLEQRQIFGNPGGLMVEHGNYSLGSAG
ncbi:hypothetical protein D9M71_732600 [compost metagenome]